VPARLDKGLRQGADFGLAKLPRPVEKVSWINPHRVGDGYPTYMAPRAVRGQSVDDHRADICSLGVILFEMLTGKVPSAARLRRDHRQAHHRAGASGAHLAPRAVADHRSHPSPRHGQEARRAPDHGRAAAAMLDPDGYAATALRSGIVQGAPGTGDGRDVARADPGVAVRHV
jgi:serine/threonine protein kinase